MIKILHLVAMVLAAVVEFVRASFASSPVLLMIAARETIFRIRHVALTK